MTQQTINDVMTSDLVTLDAAATLIEASKAMAARDIGDVLIVENDQLYGILTDRDIVVRGLAEGVSPNARVAEIATTDLEALAPEDDVEEAVRRMREAAIRRLPVVRDGRPVGVVTIGDLATARDPESALADISAAEPQT